MLQNSNAIQLYTLYKDETGNAMDVQHAILRLSVTTCKENIVFYLCSLLGNERRTSLNLLKQQYDQGTVPKKRIIVLPFVLF